MEEEVGHFGLMLRAGLGGWLDDELRAWWCGGNGRSGLAMVSVVMGKRLRVRERWSGSLGRILWRRRLSLGSLLCY